MKNENTKPHDLPDTVPDRWVEIVYNLLDFDATKRMNIYELWDKIWSFAGLEPEYLNSDDNFSEESINWTYELSDMPEWM